MASQDFSGQEIVTVLQKFGIRHDRTRGDHAILKYTHPNTGEKRTVTVPFHDRVRIGTVQWIAD
jgi:predicted RNA binding protein YcfA (HicA-like mRNA interferase family)